MLLLILAMIAASCRSRRPKSVPPVVSAKETTEIRTVRPGGAVASEWPLARLAEGAETSAGGMRLRARLDTATFTVLARCEQAPDTIIVGSAREIALAGSAESPSFWRRLEGWGWAAAGVLLLLLLLRR